MWDASTCNITSLALTRTLLTDMPLACVYSTSSPKHLVKMTGLTPGTAYQYRVGDGITW